MRKKQYVPRSEDFFRCINIIDSMEIAKRWKRFFIPVHHVAQHIKAKDTLWTKCLSATISIFVEAQNDGSAEVACEVFLIPL